MTFDNGLYILYFNGQPIHTLQRDPHPINSQNAATLGYVDDDYKDSFYGYFDDVSIHVGVKLLRSVILHAMTSVGSIFASMPFA